MRNGKIDWQQWKQLIEKNCGKHKKTKFIVHFLFSVPELQSCARDFDERFFHIKNTIFIFFFIRRYFFYNRLFAEPWFSDSDQGKTETIECTDFLSGLPKRCKSKIYE